MNQWKSIICTILYVIMITVVLTVSWFVKNEKLGISLYQLILNVIANMWIGTSVVKFYEWLRKD